MLLRAAIAVGLAGLLLGMDASAQGPVPARGQAKGTGAAPGSSPSAAGAEEASPDAAAEDPATIEAKRHFEEGAALVKKHRWAEALSEFEKADALKQHPVTSYNVGYCLRALGHYARARTAFSRALEQNRAAGAPIAAELVERMTAYTQEIDALLAHYAATLDPPDAKVSVDGRPLAPGDREDVLWAGVLPPGEAASPGRARFELVIEPGSHVVALHRQGFRPAIVRLDVAPGTREPLSLAADKLPAKLRVSSTPSGAAVRVNERDAGTTPLALTRPGGDYRLLIAQQGYDDYRTTVSLAAGEEAAVAATLEAEETSVFERWWFWSGVAAVVAGTAVVTYALTRPEPEPEPYSGGGLGWVVAIP